MNTTVTLQPAYFSRRSLADWAFALLSLLGGVVLNLVIGINHRTGRYIAI